MHNRRLHRLCAFAALILTFEVAHGAESPRDRFLREYPEAARRMLEYYRRDGSGHVTKTSRINQATGGRTYENKSEYYFYISGDDIRVDEVASIDPALIRPKDVPVKGTETDNKGAKEKPDKVRFENSRVNSDGRSFAVGREQPDKPLALEGMSKAPSKATRSTLSFLVEAPFCVQTERISDLIHKTAYSIEAVTEENIDGKSLIRVRILRALPNKKSMTGWFTLDPSRGWILEHCHLELDNQSSYDVSVSYKESSGPLPDIDRVVTDFKNPQMGLTNRTESIHEAFTEARPAKEVFSPTAFGMPDTGKAATARRGNSNAYLLITLGIAALVGAIITRRFANRASAQKA